MNQTIEQKYINDISNFKIKFCSEMNAKIIPMYDKIACSYLHTLIVYLTNLAELSNQFAWLQKEKMYISSTIISRSIFEECAIINRLVKESKDGENAHIYKYLYIQDMYQDIKINEGVDDKAEMYWRRIHNLLLQHFPLEIKNIIIQPFAEDETSFTGYKQSEKDDLKSTVNRLKKQKCYYYSKARLCEELFENVYSMTELIKIDDKQEAKQDIKIIYRLLCHYSHLNLTAIDDFNIIQFKDNNSMPCFYKTIDNNSVIIQWMSYSLDYILCIFLQYCTELSG